MNITEVCMECKNFFLYDDNKKRYPHSGTFTISDGIITPLDFLIPGQYFWIRGSKLNNGVYKYTGEAIPELEGRSETFNGAIWEMFVEPAFLQLCDEIAEWQKVHGKATSNNMSPYTSESISGVYSYSKSSGTSSDGGSSVSTWKSTYKSRLDLWRRLSIL